MGSVCFVCKSLENLCSSSDGKFTKDSTLTLNNGVKIPMVGLGTWGGAIYKDDQPVQNIIPKGVNFKAVEAALKAGYRHIDTAYYYFNEEEVGEAIK